MMGHSSGMETDTPSTAEQHRAIREAAFIYSNYLRWLAVQLRRPPEQALAYVPAAAAALEAMGQTE
jgi:hypothetical protein